MAWSSRIISPNDLLLHIKQSELSVIAQLAHFVKEHHGNAELESFIQTDERWWQVREYARFLLGEYDFVRVPEVYAYADMEHFIHKSHKADSKLIAFTRSNKDGQNDTHALIKVGKYLSQYTDAPEAMIPDASNAHNNDDTIFDLEFGTTPEDFKWVYENGPESCMGKKPGHFKSKAHPCEAYATPDFKMAFIRDKKDKNRVIARAIVSAKTNSYVRIFGNAHNLKKAFNKLGMPKSDKLVGHRLRAIKETHDNHDGYVGPYVDCSTTHVSLTDDPKYLEIGGKGVKVGYTNASHSAGGFMTPTGSVSCTHCSGLNSRDTMHPVYGGGRVCVECIGNHFTRIEAVDGRRYIASDSIKELCPDAIRAKDRHGTESLHENKQAAENNRCVFLKEENAWFTNDAVKYSESLKKYIFVREAVMTSEGYMPKEDCTRFFDGWHITAKLTPNPDRGEGIFFHPSNLIGKVPLADIVATPTDYFYKVIYINENHIFVEKVSKTKKKGFIMFETLVKRAATSFYEYYGEVLNNIHISSAEVYNGLKEGTTFEIPLTDAQKLASIPKATKTSKTKPGEVAAL